MLKYICFASSCVSSTLQVQPLPRLVQPLPSLVQPLPSLPLALAPQSEADPDSVVGAREEDCPQGHHHQGQGQHVGLPPTAVVIVQPVVLQPHLPSGWLQYLSQVRNQHT